MRAEPVLFYYVSSSVRSHPLLPSPSPPLAAMRCKTAGSPSRPSTAATATASKPRGCRCTSARRSCQRRAVEMRESSGLVPAGDSDGGSSRRPCTRCFSGTAAGTTAAELLRAGCVRVRFVADAAAESSC